MLNRYCVRLWFPNPSNDYHILRNVLAIVCGQELILRKWGNNGSEKDANAVRRGLCLRHRPLVARDGYLRLRRSGILGYQSGDLGKSSLKV